MRKHLVVVLTAVLVVGLATPIATGDPVQQASTPELECEFPTTVMDATGTEVTLNESPDRIVTTAPSAAQTMWEIGAFDRVVGLTQFATYLGGADEKTQISGEEDVVVVERVIDIEPDLVLAPNETDPNKLDQLREAGLTVFHFAAEEDLDDVFNTTARIGELAGACEGARETLDWMDAELEIVDAAVEAQDRPGAMYIFYDFTVGSDTFISEMIERAGGTNLAAEAGIEGYAPISDEVVIEQDPEWIVLNSNDPALPNSDAINETTAAEEDQFVVVQIEHLNQPGPRNVLAVVTMVEHFHPDAYEEAKEAAASEDDEPDDSGTTDGEGDDSEADGTADSDADTGEEDGGADNEIPGFGPVVAAIGVLFASYLRRRA